MSDFTKKFLIGFVIAGGATYLGLVIKACIDISKQDLSDEQKEQLNKMIRP